MMTYQHGYGIQYTIHIYCWYLKGSAKSILVDTGETSPIKSANRENAIGGSIHTFEEGLSKLDLISEEIDIVVHTHLHSDHCGNDYKCIKAKFYVHENEMENIHTPHPLDVRYLEDYVHDIEKNNQIKIIKNNTEITEGIRVIHTPAHTEGGLTVLVETSKGTAAITGFCVIEENFNPPKSIRSMEMTVIPPGTHVNVKEAYDSIMEVKKMANIILPLHEPSFASGKPIPY